MSEDIHNRFGFHLDGLAWRDTAPGLREKKYESGERCFRLLEFRESFREPNWCTRGHTGYVLSGEIVVCIEDQLITYRQGNVLDIPEGIRHRHHSTTETAVLFLIENAKEAE